MKQTMTIIRGAPGSGKSTYAKNLGGRHIEADMYFETPDGYEFDRTKLRDAHAWCIQTTENYLESGLSVVVTNTFTKVWEVKPYIELSVKYDVELSIIHLTSLYSNVHGVPPEVVKKMLDGYETIKGEKSFTSQLK